MSRSSRTISPEVRLRSILHLHRLRAEHARRELGPGTHDPGCDVPLPDLRYDGAESELYDVRPDRNLWDDRGHATLRADLIADLDDHLVQPRPEPLRVQAPA